MKLTIDLLTSDYPENLNNAFPSVGTIVPDVVIGNLDTQFMHSM